jgi:AraC family transcriptional regulator
LHAKRHEDVVVRICNIELPLEWRARIPEHSSALETPGYFRSGMLVRLARRLYGEFLNEDALSPLAIEGLTLEMLAVACRQPSRTRKLQAPTWLKHVKDLLHERCTENLSLETIAQAANVHAAHLCRTFRRHYHCTLGDYVRELRIERARRYLADTDTPLCEIALAVGYSDQSHFATAFKRHSGVTPSHFRQRCNGALTARNKQIRGKTESIVAV